MKLLTALVLILTLSGCVIETSPTSSEYQPSDSVREEAQIYFDSFSTLTVSERIDMCYMYDQLPVTTTFEAYEISYGESSMTLREFKAMMEVACNDY